jgi:hypothetical protein
METAKEHLKATVANAEGHPDDKQAVLRLINQPSLVHALCGHQASNYKFQMSRREAGLLLEKADVDVKTCVDLEVLK